MSLTLYGWSRVVFVELDDDGDRSQQVWKLYSTVNFTVEL